MYKRWFCAVTFLCLLAGGALAQNAAKPLTNDDVVAMVKGGLPGTIISANGAQDTNFDVSAMALIKLKQQGVSPKIMDAMLAASSKQRCAAPVPAPAPVAAAPTTAPATTPGQPSVTVHLQ